MDTEIERAYRTADYCLWLAGNEFVLNVGAPAPEPLNVLKTRLQLADAAFVITPCNPRSALLSSQTNRDRLVQFRDRLRQDNQRWLPSVNRDPKGLWPDEPGALLLDCGQEYARALGREYGQNAILFMGMDALPTLMDLTVAD